MFWRQNRGQSGSRYIPDVREARVVTRSPERLYSSRGVLSSLEPLPARVSGSVWNSVCIWSTLPNSHTPGFSVSPLNTIPAGVVTRYTAPGSCRLLAPGKIYFTLLGTAYRAKGGASISRNAKLQRCNLDGSPLAEAAEAAKLGCGLRGWISMDCLHGVLLRKLFMKFTQTSRE